MLNTVFIILLNTYYFIVSKCLWFSRHALSVSQLKDLHAIYGEDLEIVQVDKTINSAYELKEEITAADIIAIVAPIHLQEGFLKLANGKPVLLCRNHRVPTGELNSNGEPQYEFVHAGWDQLKEIRIVKDTLTNYDPPTATFRK